jgi:hypothetical protein
MEIHLDVKVQNAMVSAYKFLPLKKNTHENPLQYSFYAGSLQPVPVFPNLTKF